MLEVAKYKVRGVSPILMHNGRLVNPLDPIVREMKKVTSKKNKTDDDLEHLMYLEFMGGLYTDKEGRITLPDHFIEAALSSGAKKFKLGKVFAAAAMVPQAAKFTFSGPKQPEDRWKKACYDVSRVRVSKASVMRCRPIFDEWEAEFEIHYFKDGINREQLDQIVETCGRVCGFGDWRPKYGRFEVVEKS